MENTYRVESGFVSFAIGYPEDDEVYLLIWAEGAIVGRGLMTSLLHAARK
jgi:hypothetical protein